MNEKKINGILIVEDNSGDLYIIQEYLDSLGFNKQYITASNLTKAIEILKSNIIEVVILDLGLPDSNGVETITKLRSDFPEVAILALTGSTDHHLAVEALKAGIQDYLIKDELTKHNLYRAIFYILERKKTAMQIKKNEERLLSIVRILQDKENSIDKFLNTALEEALRITTSKIGFICFYNEEKREFIMNSWSKNVMNECLIEQPPMTYQLDNTGIWGDVVRQRKPIILNDYNEPHPQKKGCPEGHAKLFNFLGVPVIKDDLIISVVAVANKNGDYDNIDVLQLTLLMDAVFNVAEGKKANLEKDKLIKAIEQSTDTILITDTKGVIQYANPAFEKTTGYSVIEAKGKTPKILNSGVHDKSFYINLWGKLLSGEKWQGTFINKKKDGTLYTEEASISPVYNLNNQLINFVAVKRDITETMLLNKQKEELQTQLLHAQKMESIGHLAAGIAHELNTPLQYVGDNVKFLQESFNDLINLSKNCASFMRNKELIKNDFSELRNSIENIDIDFLESETPAAFKQTLEGIAHLSKIVKAMKEFSHPDVDYKVAADINRLIESTVTIARNEWKYVSVVELDLDGTLPVVNCLPGEFNQVVLNLIINASHAIEEKYGKNNIKGTIKISTKLKEQGVEIKVTDNGIGIPEEIKCKIYNPFFTTKEVGKGTGQGLAISHAIIVNKHNGSLVCESTEGEGASFIITLPLKEKIL